MSTVIVTDRKGRSTAERDALRQKIEAADAEAREFWNDRDWRKAMQAELVSVIYEGFQHENLIELLADVEFANEFERITLEEVWGLEVFWVALAGQIDQTRMTEYVWELPQDYVGWHTSILEKKMRGAFSRNQGNIVSMAIEQMDASVNLRLFRTFQVAIPPSSPYYIGINGLSLPAVNAALTEVRDESMSDEVSISGRGTMVDQFLTAIEETGLFLPVTSERIVTEGLLGTYRGANVVKLKNFRDRRKRPYLPANELIIAGQDASKVGFWGGLEGQEWSEDGGWYWHNMGRRTAGFAVHHAERARRVVDNDLAP